jgi:photosynthetic reaction center cytochrome c subunit
MNRRLLAMTVAAAASAALLAGCERPPVDSKQVGYRGTGMVQISNPRAQAELQARNVPPASTPVIEGDAPLAKDVYQNVQVLTDLTVNEFIHQMTAQANWVAPKEQCVYCHNLENFASDEKYQKVVARRMLEMTRDININGQKHVQQTGVTCYTCHRGNHIPQYTWFVNEGRVLRGATAGTAGQNVPARVVGLTSLPYDPFRTYLLDEQAARVLGQTSLPTGNTADVKAAESVYAMMMHTSQALGVNCTYCHNSRSFSNWSASNPQRAVAWHAIQTVRRMNAEYLVPLTSVFPSSRLGPAGDVAKINCNTCHQGQPKPLNGVSMLPAHPELARIRPPPAPPVAADPATVDGAAVPPAGPSAEDVAAAGAARDAAAAAAMGSGGA